MALTWRRQEEAEGKECSGCGWSCLSTPTMATHLSGRGENILPSHLIQAFKGVLEMGFQCGASQTLHTTSEDNNLSLLLALWGLRTRGFLPREGMWPGLAEPRKSTEPTSPTPKLSRPGQAAFVMTDTGKRTNDHTSSWLPTCVSWQGRGYSLCPQPKPSGQCPENTHQASQAVPQHPGSLYGFKTTAAE